MSHTMFHTAIKDMGQFRRRFMGPGNSQSCFRRFKAALAFQGADRVYRAIQLGRQFLKIDLIAIFSDQIHHIDYKHNRQPHLNQLRCQI